MTLPMRLVVLSHKPCWHSRGSASGYATDGGFPFQMKALSELFTATTVIVPCSVEAEMPGLLPLVGHNLLVEPLTPVGGRGLGRKLRLPLWLVRNGATMLRRIWAADAVHAPIPGDVGTLGMLLAFALRKPLFVRHCGNWFVQRTTAEYFWKWFMERFAGGKQVMLATGGSSQPASLKNHAINWIFSTTLTERELQSCAIRRDPPDGDRLRLIIACRQDPEKGTGVVIEALPQILKGYPKAALDVVGDGPALIEFKRMAARLGVSDAVTFHGKVDHESVLRLMQRAHVFCYPTAASEGFPKVVLEALACGLPVITTHVSVLPQLIGTGCGILIDEPSSKSLAAALETLLSDNDAYRDMSAKAVQTARQYSVERWRDTIGNLLQRAWKPAHSDV